MQKSKANLQSKERSKERESGIELLKLLAIFLIVTYHMTQTLSGRFPNLPGAEGAFLDLRAATSDPTKLVLMLVRNFGALGNHLFFVCSAWFLVDRKVGKPRKLAGMLMDNWLASVLILAAFLLLGQSVPMSTAAKCLMPATFGLNWYVTAYVLFYLVHPYLNRMMDAMSQRELLGMALTLLLLYTVVPMVYPGLFFPSNLMMFLTLYVAVGYMKKYMVRFTQNRRANVIIFLLSAVLMNGIVLGFNFLGVKGIYVAEDLFRFVGWGDCVFTVLMAVSLLNLFRSIRFTSVFINRISALSLLIYVIHENVLVRQYLRPRIWVWLHSTFGYEHLLGLVLALAAVVLVSSIVLAWIYKNTLGRLVSKLSEKATALVGKVCGGIADRLMKIE